MDILTHTLSGIAAGSVLVTCSKKGFSDKIFVILLSGFGGILPDFDALSLWSGFDQTFGSWFGLDHSGKEIYFSKFWYSHHGFLHSSFAAFFVTFLIFSAIWVIGINKYQGFKHIIIENHLPLIGFFLGFIFHLFGDMITPASVWGGVNFFWPSKSYVGGTGQIWWWNNYDIFLIILSVIAINTIFILFKKYLKALSFKISLMVFVFGFILCAYQINNRIFKYNYVGHTAEYDIFEQQSIQEQREVLGDTWFRIINDFDKKLKINF